MDLIVFLQYTFYPCVQLSSIPGLIWDCARALNKLTRMTWFYKLLCVVILSSKVSSNRIPASPRTRDITKTNVVSHVFCESSFSAEDRRGKKTLDEVHTYAELKRDPRASLPDSFTICSTIMTTKCDRTWPTFFTILDNDRDQFLAPVRNCGSVENFFSILYSRGDVRSLNLQRPSLLPNQWTRSCMAVNTTSGLIQLVVDATLVLTTTFEEVRNSNSQPKDLSRKLILGARSFGGTWYAPSHKVAGFHKLWLAS